MGGIMSLPIESITKLTQDFAKFKRMPEGLILNAFIAKLGAIFSVNKVCFKFPSEPIPHIANIYSFGLTQSGGGKNKTLSDLDDIFFEKVNFKIKSIFDGEFKALEAEANKNANAFARRKGKDKEYIDQNAYQKYLEMYGPRKFGYKFSAFTPEGLRANRFQLYKSPKGGSFLFENTEFLGWLSNQAKDKSDCIDLLADIYDKGTNSAKVTQGDKGEPKEAKNIAQNMIAYSPVDAMHHDKSYDLLLMVLSKAFARRSFVYFEKHFKKQILTPEEKINLRNEESGHNFDLKEFFYNQFELTLPKKNPKEDYYDFKIFEIWHASDVDKKYLEFETACEKKAENEKNYILNNELHGRPWKMIKLATILQAVYNPDSKFIESKAIDEAINISNYFGKFLRELVIDIPKNNFQMCYDFFTENIGKPVNMTFLNEQRFFGIHNFKRNFEEFKNYAENKAIDDGYVFEVKGGTKNSRFACLKKLTDNDL